MLQVQEIDNLDTNNPLEHSTVIVHIIFENWTDETITTRQFPCNCDSILSTVHAKDIVKEPQPVYTFKDIPVSGAISPFGHSPAFYYVQKYC